LWVGAFEECQAGELEFSEVENVDTSSWNTPDRRHYTESVSKAREAIGAGEFFEVNFTGMFRCESQSDGFAIYSRLRSKATGDYFVLLESPTRTLCSVSPELFLKVQGGHILTAPIKGTRRRSDDAEEDRRLRQELLSSEKDRAENIMIVDLMRNDLTPLSVPGSVRVSALCEVETFANVHHLVSHVTSQLRADSHGIDVFLACFPAGSITGAPKLRAMEWIAENELDIRGPYTGSAFISWPDGDLISNVLIRTAVGQDGTWRYGAGGAVVSDSVPAEEYEEALTKAKVFLELANAD
jgi:para-aminobenzoate synthetase component 1